jgi:hypothetical protein
VRQLSPSSNLVLAILAGLGLLGSLSLSWYATPVDDPVPTDGPIERSAFHIGKVFSSHASGAVAGNTALGSGRTILVALVAVIVVLAFAVSLPALRHYGEELLRLVALASPVVVIGVAIAHPGTTAPVRIHDGLIVGVLVSLLMASAAWHGAHMREKKAATSLRPRLNQR